MKFFLRMAGFGSSCRAAVFGWILWAATGAGCGGEGSYRLRVLFPDEASRARTARVMVWALVPSGHECDEMMSGGVRPEDLRVISEFEALAPFESGGKLSQVAAGRILFFAEGYGSSGENLYRACAGVDVRAGATISVDLALACVCNPGAGCARADEKVGDGVDNDCDGKTDECSRDAECDDGNGCTSDLCIDDECHHANFPDELKCTDRNNCTLGDACLSGLCRGEEKDCSAFDGLCLVGKCNLETGGCEALPLEDGVLCDDGLFCTEEDHCQGGACSGRARDCADTDDCTNDICDEDNDSCLHLLVPRPGAEGPKGDPTCSDRIDNDCDSRSDGDDENCRECLVASDCDDGNECTAESCIDGDCQNIPVSDNTPCADDGIFCNGEERCRAGACAHGGNPCPGPDGDGNCRESCNEPARDCSGPDPDGSVCQDGLWCTVSDRCVAGSCAGQARDCADSDVCTEDACEEVRDVCEHRMVPRPGAEGPFGNATCSNGVDDDCDGATDSQDAADCCPVPGVPRPLLPQNGTSTGSIHDPSRKPLRPRFLWVPPAGDGCAPVSYDLQVDDSCTTPGFNTCGFPSPEINQVGLTGVSFTPSADLAVSSTPPVGRRYYWRVRACRAGVCSDWSMVRYVDVGRLFDDANGDGYSDVIVGAPLQDAGATDEGVAFVYYSSASGLVLVNPPLKLENPASQAQGHFGWSVAFAGDVNADGYADAIVGANLQDAGASDEGNVFLYLGSQAGIINQPSVVFDNPANQAYGNFGHRVSSAGDVNGDGFFDLLVGAYRQDAGADNEGTAFIYLGPFSGLINPPSFVLENPANQGGGLFGGSVASAGDVNGDGYSDIIVGAPSQDSGATDEGNAFIYLGAASNMSVTPAVTLDNPTNQAGAAFGNDVSSAGDVNGDGYADVIVGAYLHDTGDYNDGNAFVYFGSVSGIANNPSVRLDNPDYYVEGMFGRNVAGVGDVNGDGFSDIVIGADGQHCGAAKEGNAFVFYGSSSGIPIHPSVILDNPADQVDGHFGFGLAPAGDVNGDGFFDVIVGAPWQDAGAVDEGNAFLYYGSSSGIPAAPATTLDNPANQAGGHFGCFDNGSDF